MRSAEEVSKEETRDLLGKGWLTHDGAWFLNTARLPGIETANRLKKAAIRTMAPIEVRRTMKVLGLTEEGVRDSETARASAWESLDLILPGPVLSNLSLRSSHGCTKA